MRSDPVLFFTFSFLFRGLEGCCYLGICLALFTPHPLSPPRGTPVAQLRILRNKPCLKLSQVDQPPLLQHTSCSSRLYMNRGKEKAQWGWGGGCVSGGDHSSLFLLIYLFLLFPCLQVFAKQHTETHDLPLHPELLEPADKPRYHHSFPAHCWSTGPEGLQGSGMPPAQPHTLCVPVYPSPQVLCYRTFNW